MKKLLLIAFLALSASFSFAQTKEQTEQASVKALSDHGYLTLFIGKNFNVVASSIDLYMQNELDYSSTSDPNIAELPNSEYNYQTTWAKKTSDGEHLPISFNYTLTASKIITGVKIKGNWVDLAELFLYYWPTKITAQEIKDKRVAQCNLLSDKIVYSVQSESQALITIGKSSTTELPVSTKSKVITPLIRQVASNQNATKPKVTQGLVKTTKVTPKKQYVKPTTSRTYYTGSRGGCYYYNSNGNKTYVDRSLCN